ncbi:MAG: RNA polymerase sigma factor [Aureliella sp.]
MVLSDRDRDLLNRCLAKIDGGWEGFVDRFLPLITHVCRSAAEHRLPKFTADIRDDMVAEVLLAIVDDDYAILRRFKGQSSLGTYLVVVTRRIAARRVTKLQQSKSDELLASDVAESNGAIDDLLAHDEVESLLKQLDSQDAKIIRMFHIEHESYDTISERLDVPPNSVGPMLSRARQRMRALRK